MIEAHQERFVGQEFFNIELLSDEGEGDLAAPLADIAARHPQVKIGSYPRVSTTTGGLDGTDDGWRVRLAVEGRDEASVRAAGEELRKSIRVIEAVGVPRTLVGAQRGGATKGRPIPKMVGKPGKQV